MPSATDAHSPACHGKHMDYGCTNAVKFKLHAFESGNFYACGSHLNLIAQALLADVSAVGVTAVK